MADLQSLTFPAEEPPFANPAQGKPGGRPELQRAMWRNLRRERSVTMFARDDSPIQLSRWWGEAISGDQIGAGRIGIGVLVLLTHVDAFTPEFAEQTRAREQVAKDGIQIEHIDAARPGFGGQSKPLDEVLDHFALERIIEVNHQRSTRPAEIEYVLVDHANGHTRVMFLLPFLDI